MSAPLRAPRTIIGLIVVEAHPGAAAFTSSELEMFDGVAALFSLALQRLRTSERERVRASVELDRKSARAVQRRLLGDGLPARCGVIADTRYLPALDVGGDFYQLTDLGDDGVGAAIGDVSGKGVSAALIMSRVSSEVRRALRSGAWPSRVLQEVHATLADVDAETFVTASCLRIDARRRSLRVANAGHIPAVVRRATGEVSIVGSPSGTPLGMLACEYAEEEVRLEPRDIVLLMTDGLVEALDRPGDGDGEGALLGIIRSAPHDPTLLNERILQAVEVTRGIEAPDDMTLVALQLAM